MRISNRSPALIQGRILSCPQSWMNFASVAHTTCHCRSFKMPSEGARLPGLLITACKIRSHVRTQISGGVKATAKYNGVEPIVNRDLIGKYLCTCTFLKGCAQLALQRAGWKSTAYPLFIPVRDYYHPFGPKSSANVQIIFVEETEDWIVYKQGSNPVNLLKMGIKLYFS